MTMTQTIDVPADRRITLPREVPTGPVVFTFTPAPKTDQQSGCPICAKLRDPITGEPLYNAETIAAIEEGDAILRGEIPAKRYNSLEEMLVDLDSDD